MTTPLASSSSFISSSVSDAGGLAGGGVGGQMLMDPDSMAARVSKSIGFSGDKLFLALGRWPVRETITAFMFPTLSFDGVPCATRSASAALTLLRQLSQKFLVRVFFSLSFFSSSNRTASSSFRWSPVVMQQPYSFLDDFGRERGTTLVGLDTGGASTKAPSLPARASQIHECPTRDLNIPVAVYFSDQNEMMAPKSSGLYAFLARTK